MGYGHWVVHIEHAPGRDTTHGESKKLVSQVESKRVDDITERYNTFLRYNLVWPAQQKEWAPKGQRKAKLGKQY